MGNSTIQLQAVVDYAKTMPELNPVLSTGGFSDQPARSIANRVMVDMLTAGAFPGQSAPPWKWNRVKIPPVYTNSWQQDYALNTTNNISWFENGVIVDINSSTQPKTKYPFESNRDLAETDVQYGQPGQFCWFPNDQLIYGTWGGGNLGEGTLSNPGPGSVYGAIIGTGSQAANPFTQVKDPNGNLWTLQPTVAFPNNFTVSVTLGSVQPSWPTNPTYATYQNPYVVQTVANGGTYFGPAVAALLRNVVAHPGASTSSDFLTDREREILQLVAESYSTKEIAAKLGISVKTVDNHRTNLMRKLNLHDVASLTRYALEIGLIEQKRSP